MNAVYIISTGAIIAITCGILGCYLVLKKMAMVGDAISHAVLPGIVLAFLLSGSRDSFVMLLGAGIIGILTTFMIEFFHTKGNLQSDAAIGVTFTWLFALGVILISIYAGDVDLDQDCVLHGEIAYVPLDLWITADGTNMGPKTLYVSSVVLLLVLAFVLIGYKELYLTTFDPAFASAIGISTVLWHYLLMGAVSLTTVASFESVGAILVVALLIAPPATAYLLTENFKKMLLLTAILGVLISISGYYLAAWMDGSIAGAMSSTAGLFFLFAFIFSPLDGIIVKLKRRKSLHSVNSSN